MAPIVANEPEQAARPAARELLRRTAVLAALEDPGAIAREVLAAALELSAAGSALLMRCADDGRLRPVAAVGPLAVTLVDAAPPTLAALADRDEVLAAVPLRDRDRIVGALALADDELPALDLDTVELLVLLGAHAAGSLRRADGRHGRHGRAGAASAERVGPRLVSTAR